jgi:hypothetical protein
MWEDYSLLLSVHSISDVKKIELCTAEPLLPDHCPFEVGIAIVKLKKYKLPGIDQILAEHIQAGDETLLTSINEFILLGFKNS